jgi:hypothetical protein
MRISKPFVLLCSVVTLLFGELSLYAETRGFSWDEGFHLMAARLIKEGKRPYLDFCFAQTPLNAYWNAVWLAIFGDSWRAVHAVSALLVAGAVLLTADFILSRFPVADWRLGGALAAAFLVGLNGAIVVFGSIGQAYALCLFLTVAAFRVAVVAVDRRGALYAAIAGLLAGAAAAASLLTAPVAPILLVWMLIYNRAGGRTPKLAAFLGGAAIPFLPVAWFFLQSPHVVFFNLVEYHALYRFVHWEGARQHDLEVLLGWIDSGQALLLGLLAAAGMYFIAARSGWERARRSEFYLCAWIAVLMGAEIANAHPTFSWYFLLVVPFVAIPAAAGLYAIGSQLFSPGRPLWPVTVLTVLLVLGLARALYEDTGSLTWPDMEAVAKKVDQVTPRNATLWAGENVFFLTRRPLPEGMEFQPATKLDMPMSQAAPLHILPGPELQRRVKAGAYSTVASCDEDQIKDMGLAQLYARKEELGDCTVFWEWSGAKAR